MPIIHVELWEGRTKENKADLAKAFTDDVVRILGSKPESVTIVFTDVKKENWAKAGVLVSDQAK